MMKQILRFALWTLLGLLAMACASSSSVTPTAAVTVSPSAAEPHAAVDEAEPRPLSAADIAQTGRPQFLNAYADW